MEEMQTEVTDEVDSSPEDKSGVVGTSIVTLSRSDAKNCTGVFIHNPALGIRKNSFSDVIYVSFDGQDPTTHGTTLIIGDSISFIGRVTNGNVKIASNNAGTNYEAILVG